jgi:hypothetical protein
MPVTATILAWIVAKVAFHAVDAVATPLNLSVKFPLAATAEKVMVWTAAWGWSSVNSARLLVLNAFTPVGAFDAEMLTTFDRARFAMKSPS